MDLSESTTSGHMEISAVVDQLMTMATYLPCRMDINWPELPRIFFEYIIFKHAAPANTVPDCWMEFNSRSWNWVCFHLSINHRQFTAFHPDRWPDGTTKQVQEAVLKGYLQLQAGFWVELLPWAEFAYNNSIHNSKRMMPFWANNHCHWPMLFKPPNAPSNMRSEILADAIVSRMEVPHRHLWEILLEAQVQQSTYAGGKNVTFKGGNQVWLVTWHFWITGPSKKLNSKWTGLYMVRKIFNKNDSKLDLPKTMRNYNIFHVLQLVYYTPCVIWQPSCKSHPVILEDWEEYEFEQIHDWMQRYRNLHFFFQWARYSHILTRW